ncbi:transglycosylase SLT domain-containing protein [Brevundimonas sp.]|uniref:transglycosylase SLT domain-containing protein n=1 Tax=Brevundimonas sp. TaxID=1871086 RepID=UPI0035B0876F
MADRAEIEAYARQRAQQAGLSPDLVVRQIEQESGFNPSAVSPAGARGVMQLMPGTARDLGVNPDDWRQNVDGGVRYLAQQVKDFGGDTELALAAYNAGPGNARARGKNWSRYAPETRNYVRSILGGGGSGTDYRVVRSEDLAPEDTPESLRAQGYEIDPTTNTWARTVGTEAPPFPLFEAYARRQEEREGLALDQEQAELEAVAQPVQAGFGVTDEMAGAVLGDITRGVFVEGGQAALSGVKRGFNAAMDLIDETGDFIERFVPGTIAWEGLDGDATTPFRLRLTTQNEAQAQQEGAQYGQRSWLQRLGAAAVRAPTNEEERPETVTGRMIEGVTQFATGWAAGGSALRGWQAAGRAGQIGKALAQGALADFTAFDGQEARLSNLLAENAPAALAPAFDLLAAKEDDPELVGRLKNALEGAALGVATDLIIGGVRSLRQVRQVREAVRADAAAKGYQVPPDIPEAEVAALGQEALDEVRAKLGNPAGPRFTTKIDAAMSRTAGTAPADLTASQANVFDINLARIETPEDVQSVIVGMADRFAKDADLARRATRSWEQTREAAQGVDWVQSMAARRPGDAVNAETALAYRQALNSSAGKLLDLAREVQANPTVANQYAFRRATAAHYAIQNELLGARAEAGRALNAFKIPAGTPANSLRQIDDILADAGGANSAQELARKVLDAAENGDAALNDLVRGGALARSRELVKLVYTNSLLSGVGTPIINALGNGGMLLLNVASRAVSPRLARAFGGEGSTQIGEAAALVHGYQQAIRDVFRLNPMEAAERIGANAGEALRRDGIFRGMAPGLDEAAPPGISLRAEREEAGMTTGRPLSAAAWRVSEDSVLGRFLDIGQMIVDAPSNLNALTDDFFKTIAARGELHAQAFRRVAAEGLDGDAARARFAALLETPDDAMLEAAEREMHDLTFTRQTPGAAQAFSDLRRAMDNNPTPLPIGSMTLPFIRTPANLVSLGMRYSPLAPLSRRFRDAIQAGGAEAETAKAQMAVGAALWSVWMGMAMDGQITGAGPGNRGQKEAMLRSDEFGGSVFQPYSVRFGDRWYSFERADPLGQGLGLIADMAELLKNSDWDSDQNGEWDEISAHAIMALGQAFFDKTMLRSATEATSALLDGTQGQAERFLQQRASATLPGSSLLRMVRRGEDPYLRETASVVDAIRNTTPGFSDDLPVQRDLWGKPRTYQTGLGTVYDAIVPVHTRRGGGSAIDLEILNNGVSVTMPNRSISAFGENISLKNRPDIYSEFVRLAGEPAYEQLNAVVTGQHADSEFYFSLSDGPDGGKADYIKDVISAYRRDARAQVIEEYASDLQQLAATRQMRREQARADAY